MPDQFDLFESRAARDEGMARVAARAGDYIANGLILIANMPNGTIVLGEDIRRMCLDAGIFSHHPNAHGPLIKEAIKRGLLKRTGRILKTRKVSNHAREAREYTIHSRYGAIE